LLISDLAGKEVAEKSDSPSRDAAKLKEAEDVRDHRAYLSTSDHPLAGGAAEEGKRGNSSKFTGQTSRTCCLKVERRGWSASCF
jgi:hypothetical protein